MTARNAFGERRANRARKMLRPKVAAEQDNKTYKPILFVSQIFPYIEIVYMDGREEDIRRKSYFSG